MAAQLVSHFLLFALAIRESEEVFSSLRRLVFVCFVAKFTAGFKREQILLQIAVRPLT